MSPQGNSSKLFLDRPRAYPVRSAVIASSTLFCALSIQPSIRSSCAAKRRPSGVWGLLALGESTTSEQRLCEVRKDAHREQAYGPAS
jgi:hypothetical protein